MSLSVRTSSCQTPEENECTRVKYVLLKMDMIIKYPCKSGVSFELHPRGASEYLVRSIPLNTYPCLTYSKRHVQQQYMHQRHIDIVLQMWSQWV